MTSHDHPPARRSGPNPFLAAARWARRTGIAGKLAILLSVAAVASGSATVVELTQGSGPTLQQSLFWVLLLVDFFLLLALTAVITWRLVAIWVARRRGSAGWKLHARLVAVFAAAALMPAILMAVFSILFVRVGLETWFGQQVSQAVNESVAVAEAYIQEHLKVIQADTFAMAADLNRDAAKLSRNQPLFDSVLTTQVRLRALGEAVVLTGAGRVIAQSNLSFVMAFENAPDWALEKARQGEVVVLTSPSEDRVRALVRLENFIDAYLYVGRFVDPRVLAHVAKAQAAARQYELLEQQNSRIEFAFIAAVVIVSLLVFLAAVWVGLFIASRLARPIGELVGAAERVRQGDLTARVTPGAEDDEMGALGRAFNRMTQQLAGQRAELVEAYNQIDERRRFTETVLADVSAGIIGTDAQGHITLPNERASALLGRVPEDIQGQPLASVAPEFATLFQEAATGTGRDIQRQISLAGPAGLLTLHARITRQERGGMVAGYVITFDDVTDLMTAQRTAAWADVARRIAHEIKNPLTPIQLSAERLRRKYRRYVAEDPDVFERCIDTIVRQVGDIGRMVDEFSSFARMPAPTFRDEDLSEIVRQSVFLQQVAYGDITYRVEPSPEAADRMLRCDGRQVAQVMTNLLQNAADAIHARPVPAGEGAQAGALERGHIEVELRRSADAFRVTVRDNGIGLPQQDRERLTEPYVTHKQKGTGLGLAIVKKVMEEHGGSLHLAEAPEGGQGAVVTLVFPLDGKARLDDDKTKAGELQAAHG
ncbi:MAG: PAS domain-containing sensor histidine kinase [Sneathiellaceae bacterium]